MAANAWGIITAARTILRRASQITLAFTLLFQLQFTEAEASEQQGERARDAALIIVDAALLKYGKHEEMQTELRALPSKRPVIIFLHGCDGLYDPKRGAPKPDTLYSGYYRLPTKANELGFLIVAPDSFAIDRKENCPKEPDSYGPQVHSLREAELAYAVAQVKAAAWADSSRIVLFGHSEGGRSVLRHSTNDVRGILSTGWSCGTAQHNISTSMPVLNIKAGDDPVDTNRQRCYFHGHHQRFVDPLDGRHVPSDGPWATYMEPFLRQLLAKE